MATPTTSANQTNEKKSKSLHAGHSVQKAKSSLDPAAITHLKDLALDHRVLDEVDDEKDMSIEELEDLERSVSAKDANFKSELDYNGYTDIEEYDNDEYRARSAEEPEDDRELHLSDRIEDESITEEKVTDKQENSRGH